MRHKTINSAESQKRIEHIYTGNLVEQLLLFRNSMLPNCFGLVILVQVSPATKESGSLKIRKIFLSFKHLSAIYVQCENQKVDLSNAFKHWMADFSM